MRKPVLVRTQNIYGIAVRIADMKDDRLFQRIRQLQLTDKDFLLDITRRQVIVIIQTDFAQCLDLRFFRQPACERWNILLAKALCVMRMYADCGINLFIFAGKLQALFA